ncbi:MAG: ABC transporter ATP-binding protein [Planctomycetota bacterium]
MIRFSSVTRSYGTKVAVNALDLYIPKGEVFAFLGPNGAGKTTSIKMMVGLLQPTEGTVEIADYDVVENPRLAKSRLGYVPDQPELYDKLSGREFLRFVADLHGMPSAEAATAIEEQSQIFEISEFYDNLTEDYSHGMKQRVAFAAAMIHKPDVVILDEPMVGLDPKSMRLVKDLLRRRAQEGTTVFMSTHTLAIAEEIADRIGVINHGELLFLGTFEELQSKLANEEGNLEELYLALTED